VRFISHLPISNSESQLLQLLSAKEWVDRVKFVFNTNLPLARGDILDQPKQGIFAVNCLISKNAGVASQLVNLRWREASVPFGDRVGGVFANTSAELDLPGLALPILNMSRDEEMVH
jgi:hypothetical protein